MDGRSGVGYKLFRNAKNGREWNDNVVHGVWAAHMDVKDKVAVTLKEIAL